MKTLILRSHAQHGVSKDGPHESSFMIVPEKALVMFSGGQDSATCLAWALEHFEEVETVGFDYGQRHAIELTCREPLREGLRRLNPGWAKRLGADRTVDLSTLAANTHSALTEKTEIVVPEVGLPTSFVPGRNLLFLTFAAIQAFQSGARHIIGGMCETDYSGYPDCRDDTIKAMQLALNLGMARQFVIHTPLMWLDKAATWTLAEQLGGAALVELILRESHSCYLGDRDTIHAWGRGRGCGACPACKLRAAGWKRYRQTPA